MKDLLKNVSILEERTLSKDVTICIVDTFKDATARYCIASAYNNKWEDLNEVQFFPSSCCYLKKNTGHGYIDFGSNGEKTIYNCCEGEVLFFDTTEFVVAQHSPIGQTSYSYIVYLKYDKYTAKETISFPENKEVETLINDYIVFCKLPLTIKQRKNIEQKYKKGKMSEEEYTLAIQGVVSDDSFCDNPVVIEEASQDTNSSLILLIHYQKEIDEMRKKSDADYAVAAKEIASEIDGKVLYLIDFLKEEGELQKNESLNALKLSFENDIKSKQDDLNTRFADFLRNLI